MADKLEEDESATKLERVDKMDVFTVSLSSKATCRQSLEVLAFLCVPFLQLLYELDTKLLEDWAVQIEAEICCGAQEPGR